MSLTKERIEELRKIRFAITADDYQALCDMALRAVPDGWQAVPKEPTDEMINACDEAKLYNDRALSLNYGTGKNFMSASDVGEFYYKAMLAAAPKVTP